MVFYVHQSGNINTTKLGLQFYYNF